MMRKDNRLKDINYIVRYSSKSERWRAQNRKNHIIGIQLKGKAEHDLGYKKFTISGNCVYFLNQSDDYDVRVEIPTEAISVHFTTEKPIPVESFCIPLGDGGDFLRLIQKMETQERESAAGEFTFIGMFYRLCAELVRIKEKEYFRTDTRMMTAKEYIDAHFKEKACLDCAVKRIGITKRRFNDLFKASFNTTPNGYVIMKKINFAKELLASEDFSVSDTAGLCGFSDVYYFSKLFKDKTGMTPGEWRKKR